MAGCQKTDDSSNHSITLVDKYDDTLGVVSFVMPEEFDTTYRWIHTSDCMCCDAVKYRSHSRKYKVITEDGFLHDSHLDSGFYFTISHFTSMICDSQLIDWKPVKKTSLHRFDRFFKYVMNGFNDQTPNKVDNKNIEETRLINGNDFLIYYTADTNYYKSIDKNSPAEAVIFNALYSSTYNKGHHVRFSFKSNVHPKDSFYFLAMDILNTIKFK
jgi:hypothetical protein